MKELNVNNKAAILKEVLAGLMGKYMDRVADVMRIIEAMKAEGIIKKGSDIENDHIAFRTLGMTHLGIQSLEKIFIYFGYIKRDYYFFPEKKLDAWWYSPPDAGLPRVFISELRVKDLSLPVQSMISSYTDVVQTDPVDGIDLMDAEAVLKYLHSSSWRLPKLADYIALSQESEYAAWAIYNRYYLNHFTMSVHNLKKGYNTLVEFNAFLEKYHIRLNDSGGKIKQSPDGLLLQSSTVAELVLARFEVGEEKMIPGSYVEFAERRNGREGFEAANADLIFESTYLEQVDKRI